MWGDPQSAYLLEPAESLAGLLFQITGPAHIPWNDPRWQEVFHGYDVWVHLESSQEDVVIPACQSMAKHASTSSNLAALALHVARMVRELLKATQQPENDSQSASASGFTQRIALVGKARATAGALQLIRILLHAVVIKCSNEDDGEDSLREALTYRSRDVTERTQRHSNASLELISSLLSFISHMGDPSISEDASTDHDSLSQLTNIPELYDATVFSLDLLLVMLSTQLYQPMMSTTQRQETMQQGEKANYALDQIMAKATKIHHQQRKRQGHQRTALVEPNNNGHGENGGADGTHARHDIDWSPQSVLNACINWLCQRPAAPARSIAHHNGELAHAVAHAKGEKVGLDGMYENHVIVMAARESHAKQENGSHSDLTPLVSQNGGAQRRHLRPPSRMILDATKGVLVLSSTLILLPFRLMSLALGLWGYKGYRITSGDSSSGYDETRMLQLNSSAGGSRRTNDVLWLSESPVADLGCSLFLLLTNNYRATRPSSSPPSGDIESNSFRSELKSLNDIRWEGSEGLGNTDTSFLDPLGHAAQGNGIDPQEVELDSFLTEESDDKGNILIQHNPSTMQAMVPRRQLLTANFESLFEAFGCVLHTEVGALVLYTLLQSSPIFAASLAVRSDLDTLVLPLLRTLYFASAAGQWSQKDGAFIATSRDGATAASQSTVQKTFCPFRSQSQLYVILILLLLFSQDPSFAADGFRRVRVSNVVWYKERKLNDINLGSVLILVLLRCITFNLNRLKDPFLLSNCIAVLMNLSPNICNLHEYAAMRLASVTMSFLKRYKVLVAETGGNVSLEHDITTDVGMYGELSSTLLRVIRHCIGPKNIDKNVHLVYSLVYHQSDFHSVVSKDSPFSESQVWCIRAVISEADKAIQDNGDARTAPKALRVLSNSMNDIKNAVQLKHNEYSFDSVASGEEEGQEDPADFTFTYEEEADPEIFFVPYIWEVIVCVVTTSTVEWDKNRIRIFPLLEPQEELQDNGGAFAQEIVATTGYSDDVANVV